MTTEQEQEIIELIQAGYSKSEVAERYGILIPTITNLLIREGYDKGRPDTQELDQEIRRLVESGVKRDVIAAQKGLPVAHIHHALSRSGYSFDIKNSTMKPKEVKQMVFEGKTVKEIAAHYGLHTNGVYAWARRHKVKLNLRRSTRELDKAELKSYLDAGLSNVEISKKVGISASTLGIFCKRNGLIEPETALQDRFDFEKMVADGLCYEEMAAATGLSYGSVYSACARKGLRGKVASKPCATRTSRLIDDDLLRFLVEKHHMNYKQIAKVFNKNHKSIRNKCNRLNLKYDAKEDVEFLKAKGVAPSQMTKILSLSMFVINKHL